MKNKSNRKQHYLPQCYLKWFANEDDVINVYNKVHSKSFTQSIGNIGYSDSFYRISQKYINPDHEADQDFFEKDFFANTIEPQFASLLSTINKNAQAGASGQVLSSYDKDIFAALIGIQHLRLPRIRKKYSDFYRKRDEKRLEIIKAIYKHEHPEQANFIDSIQIDRDDDIQSVEHSEIYCNQEMIDDLQDQLLNKIWIFKITDNPVFTSDNPILTKPHIPNQSAFYEGFGMRGVEVIFPISNSVILSMYDAEYFSELSQRDNSFQHITAKETREYNSYQYMLANREIYCLNSDFIIPNLLKKLNNDKEMFMDTSRIHINGK